MLPSKRLKAENTVFQTLWSYSDESTAFFAFSTPFLSSLLNSSIMSVTADVSLVGSHVGRDSEWNKKKKVLSQSEPWVTPNRFSLDDSWAWPGGAPLPEAQRPKAGCHALAMSVSLGHCFPFGGADIWQNWQPWLIHSLPPVSDQLVTKWGSRQKGTFFFYSKTIIFNKKPHAKS